MIPISELDSGFGIRISVGIEVDLTTEWESILDPNWNPEWYRLWKRNVVPNRIPNGIEMESPMISEFVIANGTPYGIRNVIGMESHAESKIASGMGRAMESTWNPKRYPNSTRIRTRIQSKPDTNSARIHTDFSQNSDPKSIRDWTRNEPRMEAEFGLEMHRKCIQKR